MQQYLPRVTAKAKKVWNVKRLRLHDPHQLETDALNFTIKTVRKSSDPAWLEQELGVYCYQRMDRLLKQRTDPKQLSDMEFDELMDPQSLSTSSIEDVVADCPLTYREKVILKKVLYKRDLKEDGTVEHMTDVLQPKEYQTWVTKILPQLREWMEEKQGG